MAIRLCWLSRSRFTPCGNSPLSAASGGTTCDTASRRKDRQINTAPTWGKYSMLPCMLELDTVAVVQFLAHGALKSFMQHQALIVMKQSLECNANNTVEKTHGEAQKDLRRILRTHFATTCQGVPVLWLGGNQRTSSMRCRRLVLLGMGAIDMINVASRACENMLQH